jgi:N-acetylmuramoyl-L-alanine amidase
LNFLPCLPLLALDLLAPAQTPRPLPPGRFLVMVDPGHGGEDDGAHGRKGLVEKDVALELGEELGRQLEAAGLEVRLTRDRDVFVPLWDRARLANAEHADLFISLHLNADQHRSAKGSEVYFLSPTSADQATADLAAVENAGSGQPGSGQPASGQPASGQPGSGPPGEQDPDQVVAGILHNLAQEAYLRDSERLAVAIQGQLNHLGGIRQRGVKQAPFVVLRGAGMPAVLVETAFISNPREEARLRDPAFRTRVAQAITRGVRRFLATSGVLARRGTRLVPPQASAPIVQPEPAAP